MIKKIIIWVLYIPCLWLFIEGSSFLALYAFYTVKDKQDLTTQKMLPTLKPFKKHTLFFPDKIYLPNQYDAFISHRFAPNSEYHRGLGVNSYGFIHNGDAKRPPFINNKAIKVVLLGGSSMAGIGASSNHNTIASYLKRQLNNNDLNIKYEVLNTGQSGYYSPIELSYFVIELVNYKPDFVVAFDGWNDFWLSFPLTRDSASYEGWAIPQRTMYQRSIEDFVNKPSIGSLLAAISYDGIKRIFYYTVKLASGVNKDRYRAKEKKLVKPPQGKSIWVDNVIYIRDKINKTYSHIPFMEKNWRSLIGAARANNIKPILLLQPALPISKTKLTKDEADGYNRSVCCKPFFCVEQYEKK